MDMQDMSLRDFSALTASSAPAPGGGSVSAMAAAFSASLVGMVAKLTQGKKGYETQQSRMAEIDQLAEALRLDLLDDIQRDSSSFDGYMAALKLPKDTEEQQAVRTAAMQQALKEACGVPLKVAGKAMEALKLAREVVETGNLNASSDGMVAVLMGRTGVLGAVNNVRINLGGIRDQAFVQEMEDACRDFQQQADALEAEADTALAARR